MRYPESMIFLMENIGLIILVVAIIIGGLVGQALLKAEYRKGLEDGKNHE
jgi:UPF0716 family protein affecting phage T7 exclusion